MTIDNLSLGNFKAFGSLSLRLERLTLLCGINGVGKSTVLQALGLLRQSADAGLLQDEGFLLNGEMVELGTGADAFHEFGEKQEISIGIIRDGTSYIWVVAYERDADVLRFIRKDSAKSLVGLESLFGKGFQFIRADRLGPFVSYPKSYSSVSRKLFLGVRGEYTAHFLAVHQDEVVSTARHCNKGESEGAKLLEQASAWLSEVSPGASVNAEEIKGTDFARLFFSYGGRSGIKSSNPYRPTNVGFGLAYSLPIVVACLSAKPGSILLFENPEAHMHPKGQSALGELLAKTANDGVQIVVETHSDHLLNGIRLAVKNQIVSPKDVAIHFFNKSKTDGTLFQQSPALLPNGRLSDWPEGFFDEWDNAIDKLLD